MENKKAIDIIRDEMAKRKEECKTEEEEKKIDKKIEFLNENDYVFFTIDYREAISIFETLGMDENYAIELYRELLSKENQKEYEVFTKKQNKRRIINGVKQLVRKVFVNKMTRNKDEEINNSVDDFDR